MKRKATSCNRDLKITINESQYLQAFLNFAYMTWKKYCDLSGSHALNDFRNIEFWIRFGIVLFLHPKQLLLIFIYSFIENKLQNLASSSKELGIEPNEQHILFDFTIRRKTKTFRLKHIQANYLLYNAIMRQFSSITFPMPYLDRPPFAKLQTSNLVVLSHLSSDKIFYIHVVLHDDVKTI